MNKTKLKQLGLALCTLCLSFWGGVSWSEISLFFFGEPEYPTEDYPSSDKQLCLSELILNTNFKSYIYHH